MVALEGVAAGCVVVASSAGGLPEAVGPCGILYPNGDVTAMASALDALLINPSLRQKLMSESARHLERFHPEAVAKKYLDVFRPLCAGSRILSGTITHPSTRYVTVFSRGVAIGIWCSDLSCVTGRLTDESDDPKDGSYPAKMACVSRSFWGRGGIILATI